MDNTTPANLKRIYIYSKKKQCLTKNKHILQAKSIYNFFLDNMDFKLFGAQ